MTAQGLGTPKVGREDGCRSLLLLPLRVQSKPLPWNLAFGSA